MELNHETLVGFPVNHPFSKYMIPAGVTSIGISVFSDYSNLVLITIPTSVTKERWINFFFVIVVFSKLFLWFIFHAFKKFAEFDFALRRNLRKIDSHQ